MTPILIIITLILFGIIALLAEFLLIPGLGIAGFLGLGSLVYSSVFAFQKLGTRAGTIVTAINIVIVIIMVVVMLKEKTWKKLELKNEIDATAQNNSMKVKVGEKGITITRLAPMGTARFDLVSCEVCSFDNSFVDPCVAVEVVSIEDNKILVKPITQ